MWISDYFECYTNTCILTLENLIKYLNVLEQLSQRLEVNTKYIWWHYGFNELFFTPSGRELLGLYNSYPGLKTRQVRKIYV
jgi:hypothetical protein